MAGRKERLGGFIFMAIGVLISALTIVFPELSISGNNGTIVFMIGIVFISTGVRIVDMVPAGISLFLVWTVSILGLWCFNEESPWHRTATFTLIWSMVAAILLLLRVAHKMYSTRDSEY